MSIPARLGIVTLGVADLDRSDRLLRGARLGARTSSSDAIVWFRTADTNLGLFPWDELAADASLPPEPRARFGGITLAINVDAPEDVAPALAAAVAAGARSSSPRRRPTGAGRPATSPTPMATPGRSPTTRSSRSAPTGASRIP